MLENSFPMSGYNAMNEREEYAYELLIKLGDDEDVREKLKYYSNKIRVAGTPESKERIRIEFYDFLDEKNKLLNK
jgi:hypothetical protein